MIPIASHEYIRSTNEIMMNHEFIIGIHLMHVFLSFSSQEKIKPNKQSPRNQTKSSKVAANPKLTSFFSMCHMDPVKLSPEAKLVAGNLQRRLGRSATRQMKRFQLGCWKRLFFHTLNEDQEKISRWRLFNYPAGINSFEPYPGEWIRKQQKSAVWTYKTCGIGGMPWQIWLK